MQHAIPAVASAVLPAALMLTGAVFADPPRGPPPSTAVVDGGTLSEFDRCMMLECHKEKKP